MGELKKRMSGDLELRCYKPGTCESYLRCAERFAAHFMRSPAEMEEAEKRISEWTIRRDSRKRW